MRYVVLAIYPNLRHNFDDTNKETYMHAYTNTLCRAARQSVFMCDDAQCVLWCETNHCVHMYFMERCIDVCMYETVYHNYFRQSARLAYAYFIVSRWHISTKHTHFSSIILYTTWDDVWSLFGASNVIHRETGVYTQIEGRWHTWSILFV